MDLTTKLISIFQIVNDWLRFAEAKNAVLLAFSGAGVTAIVTYISTATNILNPFRTGLIFAIFLLCISSLICSFSFLPRTDIEHFTWLRTKPSRKSKSLLKDTDNFYSFNDLKRYEPMDLLESLNRLYFQNQIPKPYIKEDLDIAHQITINSEIASIKFSFFTFALWLLIISILAILVSLLVNLLLYHSL
jgi:hypothetical protein